MPISIIIDDEVAEVMEFKYVKKEEPPPEVIWEDVGDPDDLAIVAVEVRPTVSSTTGNLNEEEMARRKEYREYKNMVRARQLGKRNSNNGNGPNTSRRNIRPQPQNNGFGHATTSTSANYFQPTPQNRNATSTNGNIGNNFQQQFPSQQEPNSGSQQPPPQSGSNSANNHPHIPPQAPNNDPKPESAASNANAAPNRISNPNNSIHINLGSMPKFAENHNNTDGRGENRGARFAIYLGSDKVPALNLVITPQDGNEPTTEPQPRPAAAATTPSPTRSNEAVQTESGHKEKYPNSSQAPVFQTEAELIQIIRYCKSCDKYLGSRRQAMEHQKRSHDRKFCHCCFKLLRFSGNEWKDHMNAKHQEDSKEWAKCPFCSDLQTFEGIYQHISRAHLKPVENGAEPTFLRPQPPPKKKARTNDTRRSPGRKDKETPTSTEQPRITSEERLREERPRKEREGAENESVTRPPISQERRSQGAANLRRPPPRTVPETEAEDRLRAAATSKPAEPPEKNPNLGNVQKEAQARGVSSNTSYPNFQMVRQDYEKTVDKNNGAPPIFELNESNEDYSDISTSPASNNNKAIHEVNRIKYGGSVRFDHKIYELNNTCNIDGVLQVLYALYKVNPASKQFIDDSINCGSREAKALKKIFGFLDKKDFMNARSATLFKLLNLNPDILEDGDLFDSEERFIHSIRNFVRLVCTLECQNNCQISKATQVNPTDLIFESPQSFLATINGRTTAECDFCPLPKPILEKSYSWVESEGAPPFFIYQIAAGSAGEVTERAIPKIHHILRKKYELFAYTYWYADHYKAVFCWSNQLYIYDGLRAEKLQTFFPAPQNHRLSTVWLRKIQT